LKRAILWALLAIDNNKTYLGPHVKCPIFEFSWYILIKVSLIKFHDNLRSESWADVCGQMDGQTWWR